MSSRQRMLAALNCNNQGDIPCSFMLFNGLKDESTDYLDFISRQLDLGLDPYVQIPPRPPVVVNDTYNLHGLPVSYHPLVVVNEWKEIHGGSRAILVKEYITPAGTLRAQPGTRRPRAAPQPLRSRRMRPSTPPANRTWRNRTACLLP